MVFPSCSALFLQLLTVPFEKEQTIISFYRYAAKEKKGGGLLGGIFTKLLCPAVGVAGTYVIVIILMIIFLVLITEKSFLRGLKKGSAKVYTSAKEDVRKRTGHKASAKKEARAEKEETKAIKEAQKAAKREVKKAAKAKADQHISGVTFDTTLTQPKEDLKELKPEEVPFEEQPLDFVDQSCRAYFETGSFRRSSSGRRSIYTGSCNREKKYESKEKEIQ